MISLRTLAQSSMLGTGRGFIPPVIEYIRLTGSDPEAALLASAAVVGIGEMGGQRPALLEGSEAVCPFETSRYLSDRAFDLLKRLLGGEFEAVLPEFLRLTADCDLVVPPETLPALLGLDHKGLRPLVIRVVGKRGRWLAGQNPAWAYAMDREPQDIWEHGTRSERAAALESLRLSDPGLARQWVQSTYEQDSPEDRVEFIAALSVHLSMDDEPFLEVCLDDKRKEVREVARKLLQRLEQSRFVRRMWARVKPLVQFKSKFLGGDKLEVILPESLDSSAKRDGLGGLQARKKMGEKANLLAQMLSLIPPVLWSREFDRSPARLVSVALSCEWKEPLLLGWQMAAQNSGDNDWAEALIELWLNKPDLQQFLDFESLDQLIPLLREEKVGALVASHISELDDRGRLIPLLTHYRRPWTQKMARLVVESAQKQSGETRYTFPQALPGFACWIPPELADEFEEGWAEEPRGAWRERIDTFLMTLKFRNEIRHSFIHLGDKP